LETDSLRDAVRLAVSVLVKEKVICIEMDRERVNERSSEREGPDSDRVCETCIVILQEVDLVRRSSLTVELSVAFSDCDCVTAIVKD